MITRLNRTGNRLLDRLPREEHDRLALLAELVPMRSRQTIYEADGPVPHVYFPRGGIVSLIVGLEDGREVEAASIGREGMVGVSAVLGLRFSPCRAVCQVKADCWRFPTPPFLQVLDRCPGLADLLKRYSAFAMHGANQLVVCNALHLLEERLSRWLLATGDRLGSDNFPLTQEFLAQMLGVRRQTVTVVAGTLQAAGLISYRRGAIRVLDRARLEAAACECYRAMRRVYERALH
ncbi:MAG TPA: Crp/Fnr family transcriptional regulator [Gemmataceae bacterium]|nr:Crp/Fnr family transcriptional regulator [Gemmataceae bacterium]